MAFRTFADFIEFEAPLPTDNLVGFRPGAGGYEYRVNLFNLSRVLSGGLLKTPNVLYVSLSGDDGNNGLSEQYSKRTIKAACKEAWARAPQRFTIFVKTGDYHEINPIYVPPSTSLIGDNLRRCNIYPQYPNYDLLWVTNGDYIWGFTFRGHKGTYFGLEPAAVAFPILDDPGREDYYNAFIVPDVDPPNLSLKNNFGSPLYITTSPYIQGCSSITQSTKVSANDAGCGMRIDGFKVGGYLRSMVLDSYTQFNEGGKGIFIINNGYAQLVSIFTICCTAGVLVSGGGSCDVNTSNCSFGLSGLVAIGKSPLPVLSGYTVQENGPTTNTFTVSGIAANAIGNSVCIGMVFTLNGDDSTIYNITSARQITSGSTLSSLSAFNIVFEEGFDTTISKNSLVQFYIRSQILASAITFEYIGSGTYLAEAIPWNGGQSRVEREAVEVAGGRVFFTATNQSGNFRVGQDFTIVQSTGTIQGRTFERSLFSLVTPFVLAIE